jgi:hypothetical protein
MSLQAQLGVFFTMDHVGCNIGRLFKFWVIFFIQLNHLVVYWICKMSPFAALVLDSSMSMSALQFDVQEHVDNHAESSLHLQTSSAIMVHATTNP